MFCQTFGRQGEEMKHVVMRLVYFSFYLKIFVLLYMCEYSAPSNNPFTLILGEQTIPTTSQVDTRSLAATWQRCSVALKPVMPSYLVTARAFNWHISLVTVHLYCLYRPHNCTTFFQAPDDLLSLGVKCPTITILLCKSHFVFCASHEYNLCSHHTFFPLHGFRCFLLLQLS